VAAGGRLTGNADLNFGEDGDVPLRVNSLAVFVRARESRA
jgi:hypothetical protein